MNIINANSNSVQDLHVTPSSYIIDSIKLVSDYGTELILTPMVTVVANWVVLSDIIPLSKGVYDLYCYNGGSEVYKGLLSAIDGNEILKSEIQFL